MTQYADNAKVDTSGYESDLEGTPGHCRPYAPHPSAPRSRRRRDRTRFSPDDLSCLEAEFAEDPYPDIHDRERLASLLSVTEDRIQVWFQNRRSKIRRREAGRPPSLSQPPHVPARTSPGSGGPHPASPHHGVPPQGSPHHTPGVSRPSTTVTVMGNMIVQEGWTRPASAASSSASPSDKENNPRSARNSPESSPPQPAAQPLADRGNRGFVPRRPWESPSPPPSKRQRCLPGDNPNPTFPGPHHGMPGGNPSPTFPGPHHGMPGGNPSPTFPGPHHGMNPSPTFQAQHPGMNPSPTFQAQHPGMPGMSVSPPWVQTSPPGIQTSTTPLYLPAHLPVSQLYSPTTAGYFFPTQPQVSLLSLLGTPLYQ